MPPDPTIEEHFCDAVVASTWYAAGEPALDVDLQQLAPTIARQRGLLWVGLKDPAPELMAALAPAFGLPPRALEEITSPHRKPKIIEFGKLTLLVVMTVELVNGRPSYGDTQILIGPAYLLTIRRNSSGNHKALRALLAESPDFLDRGSDYVASALLDLIADNYVQMLDHLEAVVEATERKLMLKGFRETEIRVLYRSRRDLLRLQTTLAPLVEICRRLARVDTRNITAESRGYFGEVADRIQRVVESLASLREALAFAFEAGMMLSQMQQTDITRKLAAWAAILAVPTAVAGIYGMNFQHMPELGWTYGYPAMLLGTGSVCATLYWRFRRIKWL